MRQEQKRAKNKEAGYATAEAVYSALARNIRERHSISNPEGLPKHSDVFTTLQAFLFCVGGTRAFVKRTGKRETGPTFLLI